MCLIYVRTVTRQNRRWKQRDCWVARLWSPLYHNCPGDSTNQSVFLDFLCNPRYHIRLMGQRSPCHHPWDGMKTKPPRIRGQRIGLRVWSRSGTLMTSFLSGPFFQRAQASRADVHPTHLAVDHHALALDVGTELTLRPLLRARDVVSKRRAFTADFTFRH